MDNLIRRHCVEDIVRLRAREQEGAFGRRRNDIAHTAQTENRFDLVLRKSADQKRQSQIQESQAEDPDPEHEDLRRQREDVQRTLTPWGDEEDRSQLDGSYNIGYPFRETGRYGSYPYRDDYDEESMP